MQESNALKLMTLLGLIILAWFIWAGAAIVRSVEASIRRKRAEAARAESERALILAKIPDAVVRDLH